jgi:hypothetical protein
VSEFGPGRPAFLKDFGGRTPESLVEVSMAFSAHLLELYSEGATLQEIATHHRMTVHPVWRRIKKARDST